MSIVNNRVNTVKTNQGLLGHGIKAPRDLAKLLLFKADINELFKYYIEIVVRDFNYKK